MKPSFTLKWLFVGIAVVACALASRRNANLHWACGLQLATAVLLIYGLLLARYRSFWFGFVAGGLVYAAFFTHSEPGLLGPPDWPVLFDRQSRWHSFEPTLVRRDSLAVVTRCWSILTMGLLAGFAAEYVTWSHGKKQHDAL